MAECIVCDGLGCEFCPSAWGVETTPTREALASFATVALRRSVEGLCLAGLDPSLIRLEVELAMDAWAKGEGE